MERRPTGIVRKVVLLSEGFSGRVARHLGLICSKTRTGQVQATHSISAGLDYPGVGPEHAFLKDSGRASYEPINNDEALGRRSRSARRRRHHPGPGTQSCRRFGDESSRKD